MTSKDRTVDGIEIDRLTQRVVVERTPEYRKAVAMLAKEGGLKHPEAGQYFSESVEDAFKEAFPVYDLGMIRKAFPRLLQIDFDRSESGLLVLIKDGYSTSEIPIGASPPATTELLINLIRGFMTSQIDTQSLQEASEALDGFD